MRWYGTGPKAAAVPRGKLRVGGKQYPEARGLIYKISGQTMDFRKDFLPLSSERSIRKDQNQIQGCICPV